jgi:putative lipoprotein
MNIVRVMNGGRVVGFGAAIAMLLASGIPAGCAGTGSPEAAAIEGTATYRERVALPPDAEFEAVLQDVSRADAPAMEIARTTVPNAPMPPIRFAIPYDAAGIEASHRYAVRAVIRVGDQLWFTSDTLHPVLTQGAGRSVDILLKRVSAPPAADAALLNTYWRILSLAGEPVPVPDGGREPHVILKSADGRDSWSATAGCNSMSGGLTVRGDRIAFQAGVATLMACPPPLDALEKKLVQALSTSVQWRIEGDRLELLDDAGTQTLLCEAVYLK